MKVGVYIDGFNLYYGGRQSCGKGTAGWRWLDVRSLVASRLPSDWIDAEISRVVYCTARVSGIDDPTTPRDQDRYLRALEVGGIVDHIEYGNFVTRVRHSPLVTASPKGKHRVTVSGHTGRPTSAPMTLGTINCRTQLARCPNPMDGDS